METKWENGRYFYQDYRITETGFEYKGTWTDMTNKLTIPELEQAVNNNHLTVYQALNLAYLLGQRQEK